MKQNIYDDEKFFAGFRALHDDESGLNAAIENPAVQSLLPGLRGARLLDLGSGFGDFCREAIARGAQSVTGVEISEKMLVEARHRTPMSEVRYVQSAIEDFQIERDSYDVIVSRLALHYVRDYALVISSIAAGLKPGGSLVFSVEHPVCTALCRGWHVNERGEEDFWPVDDYGTEGARQQRWFVDGVIKYHRTIQTYVDGVLDSGLVLERLLEPQVHSNFMERRPDLRSSMRRPPLLVVKAMKPRS